MPSRLGVGGRLPSTAVLPEFVALGAPRTPVTRPERQGAAEAAARRDRAKERTKCRRPWRAGRPGSRSPWVGDGLRRRKASPAPKSVVAAIQPRHLARSGDRASPCQDNGKPPVRSRWAKSRATQGSHAKPLAWRGARASLPAAPGVAPCPSTVDGGRGEPVGAGGPSRQRRAHASAASRGA